jgi:CRP/FNR family cyclic AMP-dependent transcriptional regulator
VKLTVLSERGKEAVVAILGTGDLCGEGCLAGQARRMATATAIEECKIMRLEKAVVVRLLHDEPEFSARFMSHLLARNIRVEADLVDQLFNSSEKRLARSRPHTVGDKAFSQDPSVGPPGAGIKTLVGNHTFRRPASRRT